jgi:hypothetical protein
MLNSAITFYEELVRVVVCPFLIAPTWEGIQLDLVKRGPKCTEEDRIKARQAFEALAVFKSETIELSVGKVQLYKCGESCYNDTD